MTVAITGGTGFVGSHLARLLAASRHEVALIARGLCRHGPAGRAARLTFSLSDPSDPVALAGAFAGCEAVAHCAGAAEQLRQGLPTPGPFGLRDLRGWR